MKNKEKILKYLAGQMSKAEKDQFENEISRDAALEKELNSANGLLEQINKFSDVETDEAYFSSLIPEIRRRLEKDKKRRKVYRFSVAFTSIIILILAFVYFSGNQKHEVLLSDSEMEKIIDEIPQNLVSTVLSGTVDLRGAEIQIDEFDLTGEYLSEFSESDFIYLLNSFSNEELNELSEYLTETKTQVEK